eukprot:3180449-Prymnesium_polylepis.1
MFLNCAASRELLVRPTPALWRAALWRAALWRGHPLPLDARPPQPADAQRKGGRVSADMPIARARVHASSAAWKCMLRTLACQFRAHAHCRRTPHVAPVGRRPLTRAHHRLRPPWRARAH